MPHDDILKITQKIYLKRMTANFVRMFFVFSSLDLKIYILIMLLIKFDREHENFDLYIKQLR